jgi:hypothetical protein
VSGTTAETEIAEFISRVVHEGSNYRMAAMEELYTQDLAIMYANPDGTVTSASRGDVFAEFAERGRMGDKPLSTEYRILHIQHQDDHATALLYRRMSDEVPPFLYELRLKREAKGWQVAGETVTPWPDPSRSGAFLPPRQNA